MKKLLIIMCALLLARNVCAGTWVINNNNLSPVEVHLIYQLLRPTKPIAGITFDYPKNKTVWHEEKVGLIPYGKIEKIIPGCVGTVLAKGLWGKAKQQIETCQSPNRMDKGGTVTIKSVDGKIQMFVVPNK